MMSNLAPGRTSYPGALSAQAQRPPVPNPYSTQQHIIGKHAEERAQSARPRTGRVTENNKGTLRSVRPKAIKERVHGAQVQSPRIKIARLRKASAKETVTLLPVAFANRSRQQMSRQRYQTVTKFWHQSRFKQLPGWTFMSTQAGDRSHYHVPRAILTAVLAGLLTVDPASSQGPTLDGRPAIVIAHRGASGYLPEHTLEAYAKAIEMGADYIEPDVVATKDGVLIARHEPMLGATTDVADRAVFADRRRRRKVDGIEITDWFACDFTLEEIRQLRAKQAMPEREQAMNGKFQVPTLKEVIDLAKSKSAELGRMVGVYPETKHPTFHQEAGLQLEDRLLQLLHEAGWTEPSSPVIVQSFEVANLKYLRSKTRVRLVQLVDADDVDREGNIVLKPPRDRPYDFTLAKDPRTFKDLVSKAGLADITTYADGVGPWKRYIVSAKQIDADGDGEPDDLNGDGRIDERDRVLLPPSSLIADAHAVGLFVHTWTFRNEPRRLASDYKDDPVLELKMFYALGIDGLFSDFPDTARKARF
jgi:glycerophosphoryl diester phosphodiesterase